MTIEVSFAVLTAVTIGLVEVVKRLGLNIKFAPLASIAFGLALSFIFVPDWKQAILIGLVSSLTSVGIFSSAKNTTEGFQAMAQQKGD